MIYISAQSLDVLRLLLPLEKLYSKLVVTLRTDPLRMNVSEAESDGSQEPSIYKTLTSKVAGSSPDQSSRSLILFP